MIEFEGLKDALESMSQMADSMEKTITVSKADEENYETMDIKETMYEDLLSFLLYLSAADHFISNEESEFIEEYLGYSINPQEMKSRILQEDMQELPERIPKSFQIFVSFDEALIETGVGIETSASKAVYQMYKYLGKCFINIDGESTGLEELQLALYLQFLREFREEELDLEDDETEDGPKEGITGGVKLW